MRVAVASDTVLSISLDLAVSLATPGFRVYGAHRVTGNQRPKVPKVPKELL